MNSNTNEHRSREMPVALAGVLVAVLTVLALIATYRLGLSVSVQAIVWIGWLILSMLILFFTEQGRQAFLFAKESKIEMQKVVWPSRIETVQTTMIVMAMVAATGFVLWAIDMSMMWFIGKITHLG